MKKLILIVIILSFFFFFIYATSSKIYEPSNLPRIGSLTLCSDNEFNCNIDGTETSRCVNKTLVCKKKVRCSNEDQLDCKNNCDTNHFYCDSYKNKIEKCKTFEEICLNKTTIKECTSNFDTLNEKCKNFSYSTTVSSNDNITTQLTVSESTFTIKTTTEEFYENITKSNYDTSTISIPTLTTKEATTEYSTTEFKENTTKKSKNEKKDLSQNYDSFWKDSSNSIKYFNFNGTKFGIDFSKFTPMAENFFYIKNNNSTLNETENKILDFYKFLAMGKNFFNSNYTQQTKNFGPSNSFSDNLNNSSSLDGKTNKMSYDYSKYMQSNNNGVYSDYNKYYQSNSQNSDYLSFYQNTNEKDDSKKNDYTNYNINNNYKPSTNNSTSYSETNNADQNNKGSGYGNYMSGGGQNFDYSKYISGSNGQGFDYSKYIRGSTGKFDFTRFYQQGSKKDKNNKLIKLTGSTQPTSSATKYFDYSKYLTPNNDKNENSDSNQHSSLNKRSFIEPQTNEENESKHLKKTYHKADYLKYFKNQNSFSPNNINGFMEKADSKNTDNLENNYKNYNTLENESNLGNENSENSNILKKSNENIPIYPNNEKIKFLNLNRQANSLLMNNEQELTDSKNKNFESEPHHHIEMQKEIPSYQPKTKEPSVNVSKIQPNTMMNSYNYTHYGSGVFFINFGTIVSGHNNVNGNGNDIGNGNGNGNENGNIQGDNLRPYDIYNKMTSTPKPNENSD